MEDEVFHLHCNECRLIWSLSVSECSVGQFVACPFCGNRQFAKQPEEPTLREPAVDKAGDRSPTTRPRPEATHI